MVSFLKTTIAPGDFLVTGDQRKSTSVPSRVPRPRVHPVPAEDPFLQELVELRPALYRYALGMCARDRSAAEDLVHEVLRKAMEKRAQFRQGTNLYGWLARIMTTTFLDEVNKASTKSQASRQSIHPGDEPPAPPLEERDPVLDRVTVTDIQKAANRLPPKQRLVFIEFHFNRKKHAQIMEEHGIPMGSIGGLLAKARQAVKRTILEDFEP